VYFPELQFCTDNGAMIALAGALRVSAACSDANGMAVRPRWPLSELVPVA
jgi:N6-L-threonylcarbamoyladenine synthase